jgi:hypothetical protein
MEHRYRQGGIDGTSVLFPRSALRILATAASGPAVAAMVSRLAASRRPTWRHRISVRYLDML